MKIRYREIEFQNIFKFIAKCIYARIYATISVTESIKYFTIEIIFIRGQQQIVITSFIYEFNCIKTRIIQQRFIITEVVYRGEFSTEFT